MVRLLIDAKRANLLPNIGALIQQMREQGYWIHESIVQVALREAGER